MLSLRVPLIAVVAAAGLSLGLAPLASADDTDTQFIGEVSHYLPSTYLDPATIKAVIRRRQEGVRDVRRRVRG